MPELEKRSAAKYRHWGPGGRRSQAAETVSNSQQKRGTTIPIAPSVESHPPKWASQKGRTTIATTMNPMAKPGNTMS